ncbi:MAG: right-handed parallel beta-helix repeat-containing protein [Planctomycetes bacterium]|nr:right-handed parallel beta-helix repeat-containing protein [Planctomycetota bacterium]
MKKQVCFTVLAVLALSVPCLAESKAAPLHELIIRNSGSLRGRTVYVDLFGRTARAAFRDADTAGMTVEMLGQPLPVPWNEVKPSALVRIALQAASSAADLLAVARFAHAEGLDEDAGRALDAAAAGYRDSAEEISAVRKEIFPEPVQPEPVVRETSSKPAPVPEITSEAKPSVIPTFHCLGIYWSPEKGEAAKKVFVKYREAGRGEWRDALPMRYNRVDSPECKADYRGSIVNLSPGAAYDVALHLEGTDLKTVFRAATWNERFPVASVVKGSNRKDTLSAGTSGTAAGYVLYDGTGCTIDTGNQSDVGISVDASYVIIRGYTIRNARQHGIRLFGGHHIVIENCDISKWGSEDENGFGVDYQGGVFSNRKELSSVVIQRCRIHHPSWDSNSWAEDHNNSRHPAGQQTIVFWESEGNHVIRYNELWSDEAHYFNDVMGAGYNSGHRGFPGADSDIYCNYIANCWDDGIEAEGGDRNVRIWNNYIENVMMPIANAAASIGPLYVWRNVSGRSYSPPGSSWDLTHGYFFKMGYAGSEKWMTGHMYIFNNTIFQPDGQGAGGLGGSSKIIKHCVTRNNIFHARQGDRYSIASNDSSTDNDFDFDLVSAQCPGDQEKHSVSGTPTYVPGAGFSFETKTGVFHLAPGSRGYDAGVPIANFCDSFNGTRPDMGAHESGTQKMQFGVKAEFVPPGASQNAGAAPAPAPAAGSAAD